MSARKIYIENSNIPIPLHCIERAQTNTMHKLYGSKHTRIYKHKAKCPITISFYDTACSCCFLYDPNLVLANDPSNFITYFRASRYQALHIAVLKYFVCGN